MTRSRVRLAALALASLAASNPVFAAEGSATGVYAGLTAANDMVSVAGVTVEDASSAGLLLGYRFAESVGIELATGGGEHDFTGFPGCSMDVSTVAVYGAFRTPGKAYFKGKMGLLNESLTSTGICGGVTGDDTGMSYGIGGGVNFGKAAFELEYTLIEADVSRLSGTLFVLF